MTISMSCQLATLLYNEATAGAAARGNEIDRLPTLSYHDRVVAAARPPQVNNNMLTNDNNSKKTNDVPELACTPPMGKDKYGIMDRIKRDLNSPSAFIRAGAIRALKNPLASPYAIYDLPVEEDTIVEPPPKPESELLVKAVVYVEVRADSENRSASVKKILARMGAQINDRFLKNTTIVVFKDGPLWVYNKAQQWKIPMVSVLWIEACKKANRMVPPDNYPISELDRYVNPEFYRKMPRCKLPFGTTKPEPKTTKTASNKKIKETTTPKQATSKTFTTPRSEGVKNKTDITRFFNKIGAQSAHMKVNSLRDDFEVPPTPINSTTEVSQATVRVESTKTDDTLVTNGCKTPKKSVKPKEDLTPLRRSVRKSVAAINYCELETPANSSGDIQEGKKRRQTTFAKQLMDITENEPKESACRQTMAMDITEPVAKKMATPMLLDQTTATVAAAAAIGSPILPFGCDVASSTRLINQDVTTPLITPKQGTLLAEISSASAIDSVRRPDKRRTIHDLTRDIIAQRIANINREAAMNKTNKEFESMSLYETIKDPSIYKSRRTLYSCADITLTPTATVTPDAAEKVTTVPKKRKLYTAEVLPLTPLLNNTKRRRTLMPLIKTTPLEVPKIAAGAVVAAKKTQQNSEKSKEGAQKAQEAEQKPQVAQKPLEIKRKPQEAVQKPQEAGQKPEEAEQKPQEAGLKPQVAQKSQEAVQKRQEAVQKPQVAQKSQEAVQKPQDAVQKSQEAGLKPQVAQKPLEVRQKPQEAVEKPQEAGKKAQEALKKPQLLESTSNPSLEAKKLQEQNGKKLANVAGSIEKTPKKGVVSKTTASKPKTTVTAKSNGESSGSSRSSSASRRSTMFFEAPGSSKNTLKKPPLPVTIVHESDEVPAQAEKIVNNQKAENVVPTLNAPTTQNWKTQNEVLVTTNLRTAETNLVKEAIAKLGRFQLEDKVNGCTTHLVSAENRRTMNMLRGLSYGVWILSYEWILDSLEAERWLNEEEYEMREFSQAVQTCRAQRQAFGAKFCSELLKDLGPFYVSAREGLVPRKNLTELILLNGGRLADDRFYATYILADPDCVLPDKIYLKPHWLLDSVTRMQLLPLNKYLEGKKNEKNAVDNKIKPSQTEEEAENVKGLANVNKGVRAVLVTKRAPAPPVTGDFGSQVTEDTLYSQRI